MQREIASYWEVRHGLTSLDGVAMYMDRIVIPVKLRGRVIENLHSAYQGTSGICSRAQMSVFWSGITSDIDDAHGKCRTCHRNAPSQANLPPIETRISTNPQDQRFFPTTRRILGAGIVGVNAGDLIAEACLAIEMGCEAEDISLAIHPHPTLSETIAFSAEAFQGTITDLYLPPKK